MAHPNRPLSYTDDVETIPPEEAADIQRVIQALELILARSHAKTGRFRADVHVKTHGYAQGELRVLPNLPQELAQGLFEHDGVYPAVVRFSNAASQPQSDAIPDGRGMAIKVLGVAGDMLPVNGERSPTQDFVMINHPVFFARNVKDYLRLEQIVSQADDNSVATLREALTGGEWNPLHWHWREMLTIAQIAGQLPARPASNIYFSMAPIRFGNFVAKYRAKPAGDRQDSYLELVKQLATEADAMQLSLEGTLRTQEVLFEFQMQLRTSEHTMPIEDASVEWPESESPYRTVAHLLLPRQEIALLRQQAAFRNLSFTVWHALVKHRPLGGINRVRHRAYAISSSWRRQQAVAITTAGQDSDCDEGQAADCSK
ncbi:MAG: catalase family protein [Planctomycetia bacterium]|nr:catalase family protein [Planctomycetia bacterium]